MMQVTLVILIILFAFYRQIKFFDGASPGRAEKAGAKGLAQVKKFRMGVPLRNPVA
jgi:hypothetical protein